MEVTAEIEDGLKENGVLTFSSWLVYYPQSRRLLES